LIGRNGGLLMGAPNGEINVSAFESVEFRANMNTAASVIDLSFGYAPRLVANTFTPPVPSKTAVVATQPGADVYFNLLNGQGGVGRFQILAGQTGQPLDAKLANSQVDIITSETTRFETESGLAFQGYKDQQLLDRPGDVFFISSGRFAGVELSTKGAMADIDVNAASLLIDADEKLSVRTAGEDGTSLRFRAADGKVLVRVDSPNNVVNSDLEDGIDINAYDGRIEIGTSPFGDIVFIAEDSLNFNGRKGVDFAVGTMDIQGYTQMRVRGLDGPVEAYSENFSFNSPTITVRSSQDVRISARDMTFTGAAIRPTAQRGNVHFTFADTFTITTPDNLLVFGERASLAIPMRQETIAAGATCLVENEFTIAHNNMYYDGTFAGPAAPILNIKDTGVLICYCRTAQWRCVPLSWAWSN